MTDSAIEPSRYAAFARDGAGGNPAGVAVLKRLPSAAQMQAVARDVGFSETVFAAPGSSSNEEWIVRYFAPDGEVPFCGHATLALAFELGRATGRRRHLLTTQGGQVSCKNDGTQCEILAPPYSGRAPSAAALAKLLALFELDQGLLGPSPAIVVSAGATHLAIELRDRPTLAAMTYPFEAVQLLMREHGWVTVALFWRETPSRIHFRNAFAFGGGSWRIPLQALLRRP